MKQILKEYLLFFKKDVTYLIVLASLLTAISVPVPFIYKAIIDKVSMGTPSNLWVLMFLYVVLTIGRLMLSYLKDRKIYTFQYEVASKVNEDVFRKVLRLEYSVLSAKDPGEWMKLVSFDSNNLYLMLVYGFFDICSILIQLFANCAFLFFSFLFLWMVCFPCFLNLSYILSVDSQRG